MKILIAVVFCAKAYLIYRIVQKRKARLVYYEGDMGDENDYYLFAESRG